MLFTNILKALGFWSAQSVTTAFGRANTTTKALPLHLFPILCWYPSITSCKIYMIDIDRLKTRQIKTVYCVCESVCFPKLCIHLASNLIVPLCGFGEIHCGLYVCVCQCVPMYENMYCGYRGYSSWLKTTVSIPLWPSVVVMLCVCVYALFMSICLRMCE